MVKTMSRSGRYKCHNIKCCSCIGETLCGEPADSAIGCNNRIVSHKTNGDLIRSMSDEELAEFKLRYEGTEKRVTSWGGHEHIFYGPNGEKCETRNDALKLWVEWINQPAEDGEYEKA